MSQLGQPLNAEIELVSLQPGEEESLAARIASQDAFNQAGIEFNPALGGIRLELQRRQGRNPILRLTSQQPLNEPFVEMLVEVQWATGKLVREYSFLLDPPEYKGPRPIAATPAKPAAPEVAKPAPITPPPVAEAKPIPPKPAAPEAAKPAAAPAPAASGSGSYEVKRGDTLGKIAAQNAQPGVSLQQMLAALYRANQDAFINGNINLLKSGAILTVPDQQTAAGIDPTEAARLVQSQSAGFAEYQRKAGAEVAAAPPAAAPAQRTATGTITPKPEAKPPVEPKDQLKLSKGDPQKPSAAAAKAARGDDAVARERALKDAQSRVADLEKSVGDLQKLLELKNQQLAELEKKAGATKPAPGKPEPPKPEPAKQEPAKAVAKAEPPKPEPAKAEPPKPEPAKAEPPKPEPPKADPPKTEVAKAEPPKPEPAKAEPGKDAPKAEPGKDAPKAEPGKEAPKAEPGKEVAKADTPKKKPAPPPPPPPPPPESIVDQFLGNPLALGGLAGVLALLAGYGVFAWRKKKASQGSKFQDSVLGGASAPGASASVLNAGAAAAAASPSVSDASVSQSSVSSAEADDVDPIAEADVYMAYGRDAQAEEILKEALAKDPTRAPVMGKLLEIYANRRDNAAFEALALKLKQVTGGEGPDWEKAAALGHSLDATNSIYGGAGEAPAAAPAAAAAPTLDFDIGGGGGEAPTTTDISLDLGGGDQAAEPSALDFDLGGGTSPGTPTAEQSDFASGGTLSMESPAAPADSGGLDFDLGGGTPAAEPAPVAEAPAASGGGGMDFDLDLDMGDPKPAASSGDVDLSAINLDLGGSPSADATGGGGEKWQEVATKLDLAKAYEEMGDKDGARDLLNEVLTEGDAAQQAQAKQMLAGLG